MNHKGFTYSDEMLNAYLDNELAGEERKRLIEDLREDADLRQRVCKLEQVRNMVQIAYHDIQLDHNGTDVRHPSLINMAAVAATVFVLLGGLLGWFAHKNINTEQNLLQLAHVQLNNPVVDTDIWRVLMHVTSDDPYRLKSLLDETENVLQQYENKNQKVAIQILANGKGLNLLRDDKSPYGKRIETMNKRYKNIAFVACAKAIKRLEIEKGLNIKLLPDTKITPSALREVLERQKEGWTYIRI